MAQHLKRLSLLFICVIFLTLPVYASEEKASHGAAVGQKAAHQVTKKKHSHHFVSHWAQTLSDEQKYDVDQLHLKLERELVVLKAQEVLKEKELNVLTASGTAKQAKIYASIDGLMEVKKLIMRSRHDHLVEMRGILTPEQRISYDMSILGRSGVK